MISAEVVKNVNLIPIYFFHDHDLKDGEMHTINDKQSESQDGLELQG